MSSDRKTHSFFTKLTITSSSFLPNDIKFIDNKTGVPFITKGILIANDSNVTTDTVQISFGKDGMNNYVNDGEISGGEIITFDGRLETLVNIRAVSGTNIPVRIFAW